MAISVSLYAFASMKFEFELYHDGRVNNTPAA